MNPTEYIVENRAGVAAAINAAARPTHEEARQNPFVVRVDGLPKYEMRFNEGVTARRAKVLVAQINKQPKKAFQ
jgi:hypothetical protein